MAERTPAQQAASVGRIFRALGEADQETVRAMVSEERTLLDARDPRGRSLVLFAVYTGQPQLAWELVRLGGPEGIHEASALGDLNRVAELLRRDPLASRSYSPDGWTPLHLACFFGHAEVASHLLQAGAPMGAISHNSEGNLPIHAAVAGGHASVIEVLLQAGAEPASSKGRGGVTPLHLAAESGDLALLELLLEKGAEVGVEDDRGRTPVDAARRAGQMKAADYLLRYAARDLLAPPASTAPRTLPRGSS